MTAVLLAADLIERAADPRHGPDANELAAMQLDLAVADEDVRRLIVHGPLEDPEVLSLTGWLWFLEWRQGAGGGVPDHLLQVLSGRATSAEARFHLRRIVGHDPALNERALGVDVPRELPSRWLQRQVADEPTHRPLRAPPSHAATGVAADPPYPAVPDRWTRGQRHRGRPARRGDQDLGATGPRTRRACAGRNHSGCPSPTSERAAV